MKSANGAGRSPVQFKQAGRQTTQRRPARVLIDGPFINAHALVAASPRGGLLARRLSRHRRTGPRGPARTRGSARGPPYGRRITFIKFGSLLYNLPNHSAPSDSGATALISGSTRIMPSAISLIAAGYS